MDSAYGEKFEVNKGVYELYGPEERAFNEPKDVVSMCYRLMWNLKNTAHIYDFKEIKSIKYGTVNSKLYGFITTEKRNYLFDLSKVYGAIPNILNTKTFDVSPEGHQIEVRVNQINDINEIRAYMKNPNKEDDSVQKNEPKNNEMKKDEVDAKVIEEEVLGQEDKKDEEKKDLMEDFEDNVVNKIEELGLNLESEK